jgi:hypothetical protein
MQHGQDNYVKVSFAIFCVIAAFFAANVAFAADSILEGPRPDPCLDRPDYVPGVDAAGQPVARADIGAEHTSIPDQVLVPLPTQGGRGRAGQASSNGPYAVIDGKRLEPLLNPAPCPATPLPPRR